MPFKDINQKITYMEKYNKKYFSENKEQIIEKRGLNIEKNRANWRRWWLKKKDQERKVKIQARQIYKPKVF